MRKKIKKIMADPIVSELLKAGGTSFMISLVGVVAGFLFAFIATRLYSAEALGIYSLITTILLFISIIVRLGTDMALLKFVARYSALGEKEYFKAAYLSVLKFVVPLSVVCTLLLLIISAYVAKYIFAKEYLAPYFRIGALGVTPLVLLSLHAECLRGLKKIKEYSFFTNLSVYLIPIMLLLGLSIVSRDKAVPLISYVVGISLMAIAAILLWIKQTRFVEVTKHKAVHIRTILKTSIPMFWSRLLFFLSKWADVLILGIFRNETELGLYYVALRVANMVSINLTSLNAIAAPQFAELDAGTDKSELQKSAQHSAKIVFYTALPVLVIILVFPSQLLGIFESGFSWGVLALVILGIGQFIDAMFGPVGPLLDMTGYQHYYQHAVFTAALLNIVLDFILIPTAGITGAAFAHLAGTLARNILSCIKIKQTFGFWTIYYPRLLKTNKQ